MDCESQKWSVLILCFTIISPGKAAIHYHDRFEGRLGRFAYRAYNLSYCIPRQIRGSSAQVSLESFQLIVLYT